ncbi:MAG: hypothetical protein HY721_05230 [Planctomycetes bacterium]|nr:hypothetical protein [Planctomycetota bacterium]
MDVDFTTVPEAFARANEELDLESLRSLTLETAARRLEDLLTFWAELSAGFEGPDTPPRLPNPLPGPTLAILLEGKPSPED